MAGKLVLCRHGQSIWNLENLFTGWKDVDLTEKGKIWSYSFCSNVLILQPARSLIEFLSGPISLPLK